MNLKLCTRRQTSLENMADAAALTATLQRAITADGPTRQRLSLFSDRDGKAMAMGIADLTPADLYNLCRDTHYEIVLTDNPDAEADGCRLVALVANQ